MQRTYQLSRSSTRAQGFTLVEILIVVIILGILAAIVIPQFTNASEDARKSSLTSQLQTIRSQVELFKLQHRDNYPTGADNIAGGTDPTATWNWVKLYQKTDEDGIVSPTGKFGPYLQAEPVNNLNGFSVVGGAPAAATGWVVDANGKVFATGKTATNWYDEGTNADSATAPAGYTAP